MQRAGKTLVVIEQTIGPYLRTPRGSWSCTTDAAHSRCGCGGVQVPEFVRLVPAYPPQPPTRTARAVIRCCPFTISTSASVMRKSSRMFPLPCSRERRGHCRRERGREVDPGETSQRPIAASGGDIRLRVKSIRNRPVAELAQRVGLCFQNPNDQFFKPTVREEVLVGCARRCRRRTAVSRSLPLFRLSGLLDRPPQQLSEGEKKRCGDCSVMAMGPNFWCSTSPTPARTPAAKEALAGLIAEFSAPGSGRPGGDSRPAVCGGLLSRWASAARGPDGGGRGPGEIRSLIFQGAEEPPQ